MTDEDTMQKAMRHKAAMNLDFSGMRSKSYSFVSLSTPIISSNLNAVGIRLGKNVNEVCLSTNVLRHMEYDRLTVSPKLENIVENTRLDEEEAIATIDGQLLSSLVGVVSETDLEEAMPGSLYDLCASGRKSKSSFFLEPPRGAKFQNLKLCLNESYQIAEVLVTWLNIYISLIVLTITIKILWLFQKLVEGTSLNVYLTAYPVV
jgi:hypothetical protein